MQTDQIDNSDLLLLLKFAQVIQQKVKIETNENAKKSLEKDLTLVKDEIGKRVLNLPNNAPVFPPFDSSQLVEDKTLDLNKVEPFSNDFNEYQYSQKSSIIGSPINSHSKRTSNIQSLSEIIDENNTNSNSYFDEDQIPEENSICSFSDRSNPLMDYSTDDIAAKFNQFIKQKELKKSKESRIPKPKSKIPIPKQK